MTTTAVVPDGRIRRHHSAPSVPRAKTAVPLESAVAVGAPTPTAPSDTGGAALDPVTRWVVASPATPVWLKTSIVAPATLQTSEDLALSRFAGCRPR